MKYMDETLQINNPSMMDDTAGIGLGMPSSDSLDLPSDIQMMLNNNEVAMVLLRFVEIIGEDKLEKLDSDTQYFMISALNQLNLDSIRNKVLLKVLPLKI